MRDVGLLQNMCLSLVAEPKLYSWNFCIMDPFVVAGKMISASSVAVSVPIRMVMLLPEHSLTRSLWSSWQGLKLQLFPADLLPYDHL